MYSEIECGIHVCTENFKERSAGESHETASRERKRAKRRCVHETTLLTSSDVA